MKGRIWIAFLLLEGLAAGESLPGTTRTIDVYVQPDTQFSVTLWQAEAMAGRIFAAIGVDLAWHTWPARGEDLPIDSGRPAFGVRWEEHAPAALPAGALASARPFDPAGAAVTLYEDRIERLSARYRNAPAVLLAYILAHELAHAMEGLDRHSTSGIEKAHWSDADWFQMMLHKLVFSSEDVDLIRSGLDARRSGAEARQVS